MSGTKRANRGPVLPLLPAFPDLPRVCAGAIAFALLLFTPGAWIAFLLPLRSISLWGRLLIAAALSPLAALVEFYIVRAVGIPFAGAAILLALINAPAIWLVFGKCPKFSPAGRGAAAAALTVVGLSVALMANPLRSQEIRMYSPHAWVYSDPVYLYARGDLDLEDPSLAGVPLSYPIWTGLVFQALASFYLDSAPVSNWVWTNLALLLLVCALAAAITKELGGGRLAQAAAAVAVTLGINPVGYVLMNALPGLAGRHLFGDLRYTPWITKFHLFSTMPLGLATVAALLLVCIQPGRLTKAMSAAACLLAVATGILYPLLFPAACGIVAGKALALLVESRSWRPAAVFRKVAAPAIVVAIAMSVTYAQVRYLGRGRRITVPAMELSTLSSAGRKAVVSAIVMSVLLAGAAFVLRKCWKGKPEATLVLLSGAAAACLLHSALSIAYWDNEYKLVPVAAICLAPFAALAAERVWQLWPRRHSIPLLAVAGALLAGPFLHRQWAHATPAQPRGAHPGRVETGKFYLRLGVENPWSGVCEAVRGSTPPNTVLVTQNSDYYFPELTSRSLYAPAANRFYPGVTLGADVLEAELRGNGYGILAERRAVLANFFDSTGRRESADRLFALGRPLAVIVEPRHAGLLDWLKKATRGATIYERNGITVWLANGSKPAPSSAASN
jgi:hypothetical protein